MRMPSGLQLAHFILTTAAKKSTALPCDDKQSVLILVPQYAMEESQMSPNYMPSPKGLRSGPPWPERWGACHGPLLGKARGSDRVAHWCLPLRARIPALGFNVSDQKY